MPARASEQSPDKWFCEPLAEAPCGSPLVQIQISTRHGHLSEESQARITAKAEKLLKIFDRLTAIEVIVDLTDSASPRVDLKVSAEHKHDFVSASPVGQLDGFRGCGDAPS